MAYQYPNAVIQVFCKAPVPGQVKTRLMPYLTADQAVQVHKQLTLRTLELVASSKLCPIQLWCSPELTHPFFKEMAHVFPLSLHLQSSGDLGQRMYSALNKASHSFDYVLLIGCDCPSLTIVDLSQAIKSLSEGYDTVLAPAEDGGYCLIGSHKAEPELFNNIAWGTSTVLHKTRQKIISLSLKCLELGTQWDVDTPEDYLRYRNLISPDIIKD